jgi:hypothetical protein
MTDAKESRPQDDGTADEHDAGRVSRDGAEPGSDIEGGLEVDPEFRAEDGPTSN